MWKIWLLVAGGFTVLEIFTTGFLVFWFGIGALFAMIASFFIPNIYVQSAIFIVTSVILLFATRKFAEKVQKNSPVVKTNAYSVENKIGKVIQEINPVEGKGEVKVGGEVWSAKSFDETIIPKDSEVIIDHIEGVKVIVKPTFTESSAPKK